MLSSTACAGRLSRLLPHDRACRGRIVGALRRRRKRGDHGAGQDRVPQSPVNESRPPYARFVRPGGAAVAGASYGENGFANSHEAHLFWMNSYLSFSSSCVISFQSRGPTRVINKSKSSHRSSWPRSLRISLINLSKLNLNLSTFNLDKFTSSSYFIHALITSCPPQINKDCLISNNISRARSLGISVPAFAWRIDSIASSKIGL